MVVLPPTWTHSQQRQEVLAVLGLWEWSHEVDAPHIEYFDLKVAVEGHFITRGNNHAYGTSNIVG
jgi:hypothetical protein